MKNYISILLFVLFVHSIEAQVSKKVNVSTAGELFSLLTETERTTITDLTVTGNIDATDLRVMRDVILKLKVLDLSAANIVSYSGVMGTYPGVSLAILYPKNEMPSYSFYNGASLVGKDSLKTIYLPSSLTSIGENAFYYCRNLTGTLNIPNSVTTIGSYAFYDCRGLTGNLVIPNSVTTIGSYAFAGCSGLTGNLNIPNSVTTIGSYAFAWCSVLTGNLNIPNNVTSISGAFSGCAGLTGNLVIPNSVTDISNAFTGCTGLTGNLNIPNSVTRITGAFTGCTGLTGNLVIPNNVTSITGTFSGCTGLTGNLVIPKRVKNIGSNAFSGCIGLNGCLLIPDSVTFIGESAFENCTGLSDTLILGSSVKTIYDKAFYGSKFRLIMSKNLTPPTVSGSIFYYGPSLIVVPSASLDGYLQSYYWKNYYITTDKRVVIDNPVAGGLASNLISGGYGPLSSIAALTITGNLNNLDLLQMKSNMKLLTELDISGATLADNLLPDNVFKDKRMLISVKLPLSLTTIGNSAFSGCSILSGSFPIPASVTSIGSSAFNKCFNLTGSLNLPAGITSIKPSTFNSCVGLSGDLVIPDAVTTVSSAVFFGCNKIKTIRISKNLTSLGDSSFMNCTSLSKVTVPRLTPPSISSNTFGGVNTETCALEIPIGATLSYLTTDYWNLFISVFEKDLLNGISKIYFDKVNIYSGKSEIIIDGTSVGDKISIYNIGGIKLRNVKSQGNHFSVPMPSGNTYLVKTPSKSVKLVL